MGGRSWRALNADRRITEARERLERALAVLGATR
jgi:hypothetical protein